MDPRIFRDDPMGLREDLLSVPLEARFSYDESRNLFFMNFEGVAVRTEEEVERAGVEIERRLAEIGRPVNVVINYDNFVLGPDLVDEYATRVRRMSKYYESVTRYTTSAFLRLKLADHLADRGLAPHLYESRTEAVAASKEDLD